MGCNTCIFLTNGNPVCTQQYGCNPYFKEGINHSTVISESFCGTCGALQKDCQCAEGVRQIRSRKVQVVRKKF
jgi:hypothetical protein